MIKILTANQNSPDFKECKRTTKLQCACNKQSYRASVWTLIVIVVFMTIVYGVNEHLFCFYNRFYSSGKVFLDAESRMQRSAPEHQWGQESMLDDRKRLQRSSVFRSGFCAGQSSFSPPDDWINHFLWTSLVQKNRFYFKCLFTLVKKKCAFCIELN